MLLVVILLGILLSIAFPQYQRYAQRAYRVEAIRMLTSAAACLERHRARTGVYDTNRCLGTATQNKYELSIEPAMAPSSDSYELTATPIDSIDIDNCGIFSLDQSGKRSISGPEQYLFKCWSGR